MTEKEGTVRTVEVDGITLDIDTRKLLDPRFTYAIGKASDKRTPDGEKLTWYTRMLDMLFGDGAYDVMCELADEGGVVDAEKWESFYGSVLEKLGAGN